MKPYYQDSSVTIYHGDCREILPKLPFSDLLLTDPPYGIDYRPRSKNLDKVGSRRDAIADYGNSQVHGDKLDFDPVPFLEIATETILWGANYYADKLPSRASWLVWDKKTDPKFYGTLTFADCELAWCSDNKPARMFRLIWNGLVRQGEGANQARLHPTQKPVELMIWCLERFMDSETILDPFMGSGTTLRAAKDLGRKAIGIEIEERYCEIAARRMEQEVLPFNSPATDVIEAQELLTV